VRLVREVKRPSAVLIPSDWLLDHRNEAPKSRWVRLVRELSSEATPLSVIRLQKAKRSLVREEELCYISHPLFCHRPLAPSEVEVGESDQGGESHHPRIG
jgi:hypothetical protein